MISHGHGSTFVDPKLVRFTMILPILTKHFRYLKWRNPHLYKLYGYGLCKGFHPPPKQPKIRFRKPSILGTWNSWWNTRRFGAKHVDMFDEEIPHGFVWTWSILNAGFWGAWFWTTTWKPLIFSEWTFFSSKNLLLVASSKKTRPLKVSKAWNSSQFRAQNMARRCHTRLWFQIFFIFIPTWGRFPFWLIFLKWVETTN